MSLGSLPLGHDAGRAQHRLGRFGKAVYAAVDTQLMCRLWVDACRALHRLGCLGDTMYLAGDAQSVGRLRLRADDAELPPWRVRGAHRAVYIAVNVEGIGRLWD